VADLNLADLNLRARDMLGRFPLIDGHNDLPWALRGRTEEAGGDLSQVVFDLDAPSGGVEHVGLSGDFDGTDEVTAGLEDVSTYPALFAELLRRGWTEPDCAALAGGNLLRALRGAESFAGR